MPCRSPRLATCRPDPVSKVPDDPSNGYEAIAHEFVSGRVRSRVIGVATVREWARDLPRGGTGLDVGCGTGVPISQTLVEVGLRVHGIDASPTMLAAFHARFPGAPSECAPAETALLLDGKYDGVVAWGLIFLLAPKAQATVIRRMGHALADGGRLLFTAPREPLTWSDNLTGLTSYSLGWERYVSLLQDAGLTLTGSALDEGENHYYFARR